MDVTEDRASRDRGPRPRRKEPFDAWLEGVGQQGAAETAWPVERDGADANVPQVPPYRSNRSKIHVAVSDWPQVLEARLYIPEVQRCVNHGYFVTRRRCQ
jgi:hypothetical protein